MGIKSFVIALVIACLLALTTSAQDSDPVCRDLFDRVEVPAADEPSPEQAKRLDGCDSERLYYGKRSPESLRKARHCAFIEREGYDLPTVSGSAVLMMLYANGSGVERNIELAQLFNCEIGGSVDEIQTRRRQLEAFAKAHEPREFDVCDGASGGFMKEICDGKAARLRR
jgi:hypothetical protein